MKAAPRFKKISLLILMTMIGTLLLSACSGGADSSSEPGKEKATVNIAVNGGLNLLSIAKNKGWFEEEFKKVNADVQWHEFQSSAPLLEGIITDRIDFSFIGDGTLVTGAAAKSPIKAISVTGVEGNQNSIIVKPDSPIQSIADLKGKTIAIAKGSSAHIFLIKALEKNGLKESDVKLVQLQPDEANPAFQTGKVDAWGIWDPFVTTEVQSNRARIVASVKTMNFVAPAVMIGRDKFLQEHPDLTEVYLKVYQRAVEWLPNNIDEAADILSKERKMDKALVKTLLENTHYINAPISADIASSIQSTADILAVSGTIKEKVDMSKSYDNSFLEKALKK